MEITRCLREEHDLILRVLDALEVALRHAREGNRIQRGLFQPFVNFFQEFVGRCHQTKEETILFPAIEKSGMPTDGGPVGAMIHEHRLAGEYACKIADTLESAERGAPEAVRLVLAAFGDLLDLLRRHIDKDSHCVLGMAERVVGGAEQREAVLQSYRDFEDRPEHQEAACRCRRLADELVAAHQPHTNAV